MVLGNFVYLGAVTDITEWTGDSSWRGLFFLGLRISDYGEEFKAVLKTTGVNDQLEGVALSADFSELYFNSAYCSWNSPNYNCGGYMVKMMTASPGSVAW